MHAHISSHFCTYINKNKYFATINFQFNAEREAQIFLRPQDHWNIFAILQLYLGQTTNIWTIAVYHRSMLSQEYPFPCHISMHADSELVQC